MRKHLFIGLLIIQLIIIILFVGFFSMVETFGQGFTVLAKPDVYSFNHKEPLSGNLYLNYDFQQISNDEWPEGLDVSAGDAVYVLLGENADGVYEWKDVSTKKWKNINDNEIIIHATYSFYEGSSAIHHVRYPFQTAKHVEAFGTFHNGDTLLLTVYKGLFGQYTITQIQTDE